MPKAFGNRVFVADQSFMADRLVVDRQVSEAHDLTLGTMARTEL